MCASYELWQLYTFYFLRHGIDSFFRSNLINLWIKFIEDLKFSQFVISIFNTWNGYNSYFKLLITKLVRRSLVRKFWEFFSDERVLKGQLILQNVEKSFASSISVLRNTLERSIFEHISVQIVFCTETAS